MSSFVAAAVALQEALAGLDPRLFSGEDAAVAAEVLAHTEKVCAAARVRLASRASECGAHRDRGFSSPSEWLASASGTTAGEANEALELAAGLEDLPATKGALERGELSLKQASEIAKTERAAPGSEEELLDVARRRGLRGVKERGRRKRQEAMGAKTLAERRRAAREFTHCEDELGMVCGRFRLEPHHGVRFIARLQAEIDRRWRAGTAEYRVEPRPARAADAFAALLDPDDEASKRRGGVELVAVWNLNADTAHIPGVGPIDFDTLRTLAKQALVTTALHDGVDLRHYQRHGRHILHAMKVLLALGPAPDFDGARCLDCGRRFHLELDHLQPLAADGVTAWWNLGPRCPPCHDEKTRRDREAGLLRPGKREPRQPKDPVASAARTSGRGPP